MSAPPKWANDLFDAVWWAHGEPQAIPRLTWRRSRVHGLSSGRYLTREHRIVVTAGKSRQDQKLTLLHEIAHALTPGEHHSDHFWMVAWKLYRRWGVPIKYAREREGKYRKGSEVAYRATRPRSAA